MEDCIFYAELVRDDYANVIDISSSYGEFMNNQFIANSIPIGFGMPTNIHTGNAVGVETKSIVLFEKNTFYNFKGKNWGGAVSITGSSSAYFKDNLFQDNAALTGGAVLLKKSANVTFDNNVFLNNRATPQTIGAGNKASLNSESS